MYFIFVIMPILSVLKITMQGKYSQKNVKTFSDVLIFNTISFLFSTIILAIIFLREIPPVEVWIYALISGFVFVFYQVFYTFAFKKGPISATAIIVSFYIVFVLLSGLIFYNETWNAFTIIGLCFMFIAFYLIPSKSNDKKANLIWLIFTILTFIFAGLSGSILFLFSKSTFSSWKTEYITLFFVFATLLSSLFTLFNVKVRKDPITIKRSRELPIVSSIIGLALGIYYVLYVVIYQYYPSYIVSPIISGTTIALTMIVNSIINKEKPTLKMLIGVGFAVIAIVLLNI